MKRLITPVIAILAFASVLILFTAPKQIFAKVHAEDSPKVCTLESYEGSFGFSATGTIFGKTSAFVGKYTADGDGHIAGTQTSSIDGVIQQNETFTGTYTVNSDCTGSSTLNFGPFFTQYLDFVLVHHGSEIISIATNPSTVVTSIDRKQ